MHAGGHLVQATYKHARATSSCRHDAEHTAQEAQICSMCATLWPTRAACIQPSLGSLIAISLLDRISFQNHHNSSFPSFPWNKEMLVDTCVEENQ